MRRFIVLGHKAASAPGFSMKDLAGTGGRIDILARCVGASFLVSHGLRDNVELVTMHMGPPTPPKAVRMQSAHLKHINPDERSSASILEKALGTFTTGPVWQPATPGVHVAVLSLQELLGELGDAPLYLLDEQGDDIATAKIASDATFIVGDHLGFTPEEEAALKERAAGRISLGPVSLQADQCITVLHNHLDRR